MILRGRGFFLALCTIYVSFAGYGQAPFRVKDINTTVPSFEGSFPSGFAPFGTSELFVASDNFHGQELWKTDGTAAGTTFIKDVNPGKAEGLPVPYFVVSNGIAYFQADDGLSGVEPWRSDGTAAGTFRLRDICPGSCTSNPGEFTAVNGTVYFSAQDPTNGRELWQTDGTQAGTLLVTNINSGANSSSPSFLTSFAGTLFFSADDGTHGQELWRLVSGAPALFLDIDPVGSQSSSPYNFSVSNGKLFFGGSTSGTPQIFATDGTNPPVVTSLANTTLAYIGAIASFFPVSGLTVFAASDAATGTELWVTNGTPAGTHPLAQIAPGSLSGTGFGGAAVLGNFLYFAGTPDGSTANVYRTDGSSVSLFFSANPGFGSSPAGFTTVGSLMYFSANGPASDTWVTNGTTTTALTNTFLSPFYFSPFGSGVIFTSFNKGEPWKSDGTVAGTTQFADVNPDIPSSFPFGFVGDGTGKSAFLAEETFNLQVWLTDGTTAGTVPIVNSAGPPYGSASNLVRVNGAYYFSAFSSGAGTELWKTDGTNAGTAIVADICTGSCSSSPQYLTPIGNALYFAANDGIHGNELWRLDTTTGVAAMVSDVNTGSLDGLSFNDPFVTAVGATVFFLANDGATGTEWWKTNGTGATRVSDVTPGSSNNASFTRPVAVNASLFFGVNKRLEKTDGTTVTILSALQPQNLGDITPLNATSVIFHGSDANGIEVWKSDGTAGGTARLFDINPGTAGSLPQFTTLDIGQTSFASFGGAVYFAADDGANGMELWRTDGTTTTLFRDICAGVCSSNPQSFLVFNSRLYFQADDRTGGEELWITDGTFAGTVRVADIEPGTGGSSPFAFGGSGNLLYFSADTSAAGFEPYVACTAPATQYTASAPANVIAGASFSMALTPRDAGNGLVPCYTGSAQFTSDDPSAILPSASAFVAGEGAHTVSPVLRGLGLHTVTATDTVTSAIKGSVTVTVGASPVTSTISGSPAAIIANGSSTSTITVQYKDATGSNLTTGGGTLSLATTLGSLSAITNNNNGTYRATLTSGTVSGPAVITGVLDGTAMTNSGTVQLLAGAAASLDVGVPVSATADAPFSMTVSARDTNGNVADTYTGTVHFSAVDTSPTVPANYTFQPGDNGVHTFTNGVVLHTIGNRQLNASDIANGSISGVAIVAVSGATTTSLQSTANPVLAGTSITLTANVSSTALGGSPAGTVTFRDGATNLAAPVPLVSGSASLTTSSLAAGTHNLTAVYNPSNAFLTSTSATLVEFVGSLSAPVITASFDPPNKRVVITFGTTAGAQTIEILRSNDNKNWSPVGTVPAGSSSTLDGTADANVTWLYVAHFFDASAHAGLDSNIDPATTVSFDDDPITNPLAIRFIHIIEARAAIDLFRATVGLSPANYSNKVAPSDPIRAVDWTETRANLDEARSLVARITVVPPYTDAALTTATPVKGAHLNDLWTRMK